VIDKLLRVGSLLSGDHSEVDAELLCDAVWLAALGLRHATIDQTPQVLPDRDEQRGPDPEQSAGRRGSSHTSTDPGGAVGLHSPAASQSEGTPGQRVKVSGAPAIARRLEFDRSLRALRGRYPSKYRQELDIEGTVAATCEARQCVPVLHAARDRWLDVVLIVEQSPTMRVWQETAADWRDAILRAAAPRTLTVAWLEWSPKKGLTLKNRRGDPVPSRSLIVPGRASLVFYLADAVGPGWMTAEVPRQLDQWSKDAAVVLLQVLPRALWDLSSLRRGLPVPGRDGTGVRPWRDGVRGLPGVFVCCLNPEDIGNLAARLTGRAAGDSAVLPANLACYIDPKFKQSAPAAESDASKVPATEVDEIYRDFVQFGSEDARRVAQHIACVPDGHALTLPLMRLIQRTLVPDAAPWQLAEMFLSGLLYRTQTPDAASHEPEYSFLGDIRRRLRDDAGAMRRVETRVLLSQYLHARVGKGATFDAVVPTDAESSNDAAGGAEPFATVPEAVIGGAGASRIADSPDPTLQHVFRPVPDASAASGSIRSAGPVPVKRERGNRVFVSCVSAEFENPTGPFPHLRTDLRHYLSRAGCHMIVQEDFPQTADDTVEKLATLVGGCAAVLHLVGEVIGAIASTKAVDTFLARTPNFLEAHPELKSALGDFQGITYTQWEAYLALHYDVPLFVYSTETGDQTQATHLKRLRLARRYAGERRIASSADLLGQLIGEIQTIVASVPKFDRKIAASRILRHTPPKLFGRDQWLDALDAAWANPTLNVYTLVGWGGVGKTSLVAHWVSQRIAARGWPGVERYFDWSFYSQGTGESRQTSSDLFIQEALKFFDDPDPTRGSPWERGERLAGLVRRYRTLVILDGIEPLQYPPGDPQAGRLKDQALEALLQGLAADNPGLCIVTTREHLKSIEGQATAEEQKLDRLGKDAAIDLLRHLHVVGTNAELGAAWRDSGGHALTLQLLGRFLADAYAGDVRHYREVKFEEADRERVGRSAFKVMIAYERWLKSAGPERQRELALLRLTGLFDRPVSRENLRALCAEPAIAGLTDALVGLTDRQLEVALRRLENADLLAVTPDAVDAHPLIREYFAKQLRDTQPTGIQAAHSRLFDHLCKAAPYRPDTLDRLQPLYEAVVHGCLAGRQQQACADVYIDRILRGTGDDGYYSTEQLGAFGADLAAVAAFFDEPWSRISLNLGEPYRWWMLIQAANCLRALGRLTEALQPMRAGLEFQLQQKSATQAAISYGNLSELEVTLGRLTEAVADARQSISLADQSVAAFLRIHNRTTAADALHQSGRRAEAGALFAEADQMQKERQTQIYRLDAARGFRYCEWLLAPAERASWRALVRGTDFQTVKDPHARHDLANICFEVEQRAMTTLTWAVENQTGLLSIALDHLTLARRALIWAILAHPLPQPTLDVPHVAAAVDGLRSSGRIDHLPKGLLTAALYHFVRGDAASTRAPLDEAQDIAERGPMPLYLADIHLHRARLFRDRAELAKARELIDKHGYGRRREELEDAEAAATSWPA
jgi:hypothetical protein